MLILNYRHCDETLIKMYFSKVFRHGEKVPHKEFQNYPNDPYRDYSYYPLGSGDLTNVSKKKRKILFGRIINQRTYIVYEIF